MTTTENHAAAPSHPCLVKGCPGQIARHGLCCQSCWDRMPAGLARALGGMLDRHQAKSGKAPHGAQLQEVVGHVLARLGAELAGPLTAEQRALADVLTPRCHSFRGFSEFFEADDNYFPKLACGIRENPNKISRDEHCQLADLYDQTMAARGDRRRACRLGFCEI